MLIFWRGGGDAGGARLEELSILPKSPFGESSIPNGMLGLWLHNCKHGGRTEYSWFLANWVLSFFFIAETFYFSAKIWLNSCCKLKLVFWSSLEVTVLRNSMFSAVAQSTKRLVRFRYGFVDIQNVKTLRRACVSNGVRSDEGPLLLYKSYLEKQLLKPDESQSKVVYQLQGLYERLKDYDPQQKSSKLHFDLVYVNCLFLLI